MGFSLVRSAENEVFELQVLPQNDGCAYEIAPRWSRRAASTAMLNCSPIPRMLDRVYSTDPRGPQNRFSVVLNFDGSPTGGSPGRATVPPGTLPPRFSDS